VALLVNALSGFLTERFAAASETSAPSATLTGAIAASAAHCVSSATLAGNSATLTSASAMLHGITGAPSAATPCAQRKQCKRKQNRFSPFHCNWILHLDGGVEFFKEAEVVLEIMAEVIHLPFEHSYTLDTHSESETAIHIRIYIIDFEHIGIHHTAA